MFPTYDKYTDRGNIITEDDTPTLIISREGFGFPLTGECKIQAIARRTSDGATRNFTGVFGYNCPDGIMTITAPFTITEVSPAYSAKDLEQLADLEIIATVDENNYRISVKGQPDQEIFWIIYTSGLHIGQVASKTDYALEVRRVQKRISSTKDAELIQKE